MLKEPDPRSSPSYLPYTWEPLERAGTGCANLRGGKEVAPGVTILPAPGHTPNHQIVRVKSGRIDSVFSGGLGPDTFAPEDTLRHGIRSRRFDCNEKQGTGIKTGTGGKLAPLF